jgi:hypothetical protein
MTNVLDSGGANGAPRADGKGPGKSQESRGGPEDTAPQRKRQTSCQFGFINFVRIRAH